jgi:hypothetical protein
MSFIEIIGQVNLKKHVVFAKHTILKIIDNDEYLLDNVVNKDNAFMLVHQRLFDIHILKA